MAGCTPYNGSATDACVMKIDSKGIIQWGKTYGGSDFDMARCIQQTTDGGYVFVGGLPEHPTSRNPLSER